MLRGIGISNTIEQAADPTYETAEIRFDPLGDMTFVTGSISHGQGHATIQTQMLVIGSVSIPNGSSSSPATLMRWRSVWAPAARVDHHEWWRHRRGQRQDYRQGQEARRASPGGVRERR